MWNATGSKIRILFLIPYLGGGGTERVIQLIASNLRQSHFEVHLGLVRSADKQSREPLPDQITVHRIGVRRLRESIVPLCLLIRKLRPDVVLSCITHLNLVVLMLRPFLPRGLRVLVRQEHAASAGLSQASTRFIYRKVYPMADRVICQSDGMARDFINEFGINPDKLVVLHNPVSIKDTDSAVTPASVNGWCNLITIGRLTHEKGQDLLLEALAEVRHDFPQVKLTILGDGEDLEQLQKERRRLDLCDQVNFAGYCLHPERELSRSGIFVLPSRSEGMPNALLEAAMMGLPIVSTPCCSGLVDLVRNAPAVWLAKAISSRAIADALCQALAEMKAINEEKNDPLPRFCHEFIAPFKLSQAVAAYEEMICEAVRQ